MNSSQATVDKLGRLLASTYILYLKTHNYHWNVTGRMFTTLHTLFETQYTELALAVDEIAERIRALGHYAPGSFAEYIRLSAVSEASDLPAADRMIENLVADQAIIVEVAQEVFAAAEAAADRATGDLATRRLDVHEKNAWMLRSHLG